MTTRDISDSRPVFNVLNKDADGWRKFDARIEAAADRAMIGVDAETVRLFVKYKVAMPADFARDTRWRKDVHSPAKLQEEGDKERYLAAYRAQSAKDRAEVREAIRATDARRGGNIHSKGYNNITT